MFPIVLDDNYRAPEKRWFAKGQDQCFRHEDAGDEAAHRSTRTDIAAVRAQ